MEVHFGGGFARLIEGDLFSVLYVSGVRVEDAARAIPGLRFVRAGGGVVVTHNGKPVVPVVGGSVESCFELASRVFKGGAWRRVKLLVGAGRLAALGAVAAGAASLFLPLTFMVNGAVILAVGSLSLLALSSVALRRLAGQVAYGAAGGAGVEEAEGEAVREEDYYVEAARLCCEKAKRLVAEGREDEAMEYALRAVNYASKVAEVEVEASSPLQVVEVVAAALRGAREPREAVAEGEAAAAISEAPTSTDAESGAAPSGEDIEGILEVVEAYTKGCEETGGKEKGEQGTKMKRSGRLEDYM
ncbi:MAG: hypothetical protein KIH01_09185 [Candidatus Freyarchaeota archaeon]|nr:hypothetical protein [Candidatus Jordarchaeia archaeon]